MRYSCPSFRLCKVMGYASNRTWRRKKHNSLQFYFQAPQFLPLLVNINTPKMLPKWRKPIPENSITTLSLFSLSHPHIYIYKLLLRFCYWSKGEKETSMSYQLTDILYILIKFTVNISSNVIIIRSATVLCENEYFSQLKHSKRLQV